MLLTLIVVHALKKWITYTLQSVTRSKSWCGALQPILYRGEEGGNDKYTANKVQSWPILRATLDCFVTIKKIHDLRWRCNVVFVGKPCIMFRSDIFTFNHFEAVPASQMSRWVCGSASWTSIAKSYESIRKIYGALYVGNRAKQLIRS